MNQMLESVAIWMMAPVIAALTVGGSTVPEKVAAVEPVSVVMIGTRVVPVLKFTGKVLGFLVNSET